MSTIHHIAAITHGRYLVEPAIAAPAAGLLVGFHGYGETAEAHLMQLRRIPGIERWHVSAVQALHPFYTRQGEVVAGWMTMQDRELAIEDNIRYTASVVSRLKRRFGDVERLVFAGFSQGVAMAYRAAAGSGHPCHGVIALAGDLPPEVGAAATPAFPAVLIGRGTEDGWYTEAKMQADLEVLAGVGVEARTLVFDAGHVWTEAFLLAAGELLEQVCDSDS